MTSNTFLSDPISKEIFRRFLCEKLFENGESYEDLAIEIGMDRKTVFNHTQPNGDMPKAIKPETYGKLIDGVGSSHQKFKDFLEKHTSSKSPVNTANTININNQQNIEKVEGGLTINNVDSDK